MALKRHPVDADVHVMRVWSGHAPGSLLSPSSHVLHMHRSVPAERLQIGAALVASALAASGLIGWLLHIRVLISVAPGTPEFQANTTIALLCASASVVCLRTGSSLRARRAGRLLGLLVCLFGALVCFEYLVRPLGFDQLLFRDPGQTYPGRPSSSTAVALVMLGAALAAIDVRRLPAWVGQTLLVASSAVVIFAVVGYMYDVPTLRGFYGHIRISPQSVVALALLTIGAFALRPERGLASLLRGGDPGARVARILVPATFAASIGLGGVALLLETHRLMNDQEAQAALAVVRAAAISAIVFFLAARLRRSALRDQELAALVTASPEAILRARDGCITELNPAAERLFGYRADELIGQSPLVLSPPDRIAESQSLRVRAEAGETVRIETKRMRRDGVEFDVALTVCAIFDGAGRHAGVMIVARDISEQKRTEQELSDVNARLHAMVDNAPVGISLRDLDGRILKVNGFIAATIGMSPRELETKAATEVLNASQQDQMRAEIEEMLRTGRPVASEAETTTPDGGSRSFEVVRYPVLDRDGAVTSIGTFVLDVTELRAAERGARRRRAPFPPARSTTRRSGWRCSTLDGRYHRGQRRASARSSAASRADLASCSRRPRHPDDVDPASAPGLAPARWRGGSQQRSIELRLDPARVGRRAIDRRRVADDAAARSRRARRRRCSARSSDITERKRYEAQLEFLADHDPLTGLLNRRSVRGGARSARSPGRSATARRARCW